MSTENKLENKNKINEEVESPVDPVLFNDPMVPNRVFPMSGYRYFPIFRPQKNIINKKHAHDSTIEELFIDDENLYTASSDHTIKIWKKDNLEEMKTLTGHDDWVNTLFVDNYIYSGSADKTVKVWDKKTLKLVKDFTEFEDWVNKIFVDNVNLYVGLNNGKVYVIDKNDFDQKFTFLISGKVTEISSNDSQIYIGSNEGNIYIFDKITFTFKKMLSEHRDAISTIQFDDNYLITAGWDGLVNFWDLKYLTLKKTIPVAKSVESINTDEEKIFIADESTEIKVVDKEELKLTETVKLKESKGISAFSGDDQRLYVGGSRGGLLTFNKSVLPLLNNNNVVTGMVAIISLLLIASIFIVLVAGL